MKNIFFYLNQLGAPTLHEKSDDMPKNLYSFFLKTIFAMSVQEWNLHTGVGKQIHSVYVKR